MKLKRVNRILKPFICIMVGILTLGAPAWADIHQSSDYYAEENRVESVWTDLVKQFRLGSHVNRDEVNAKIQWYLSHPDVLHHILTNATPYLHYVAQQVHLRHMPGEFALLPLVESGYNPNAYSKAGATGLWQMMPSTAQILGLDINWWYDGRRDTVASTQAALDYLISLHKQMGDWLLATASYDFGGRAVQTAIDSNTANGYPTSFWDLQLPKETQDYIPKLLALAELVRHPAQYGIHLPYIPNRPYVNVFTVNAQLNMDEIARLANSSVWEIQALNPGLLRYATNPTGTYQLMVPAHLSGVFKFRFKAISRESHLNWQYHEVRSGESLYSIAHIYHTSQSFLRRINKLEDDSVDPGDGLVVPVRLNGTYGSLKEGASIQPKSIPYEPAHAPIFHESDSFTESPPMDAQPVAASVALPKSILVEDNVQSVASTEPTTPLKQLLDRVYAGRSSQ